MSNEKNDESLINLSFNTLGQRTLLNGASAAALTMRFAEQGLRLYQDHAPPSMRLTLAETKLPRPNLWVTSGFGGTPVAGMTMTMPGEAIGVTSGSFHEAGVNRMFSGQFAMVDLGGLKAGPMIGRMNDMVPQADGTSLRQHDRWMYGAILRWENGEHGVEAKCMEAPRDKIKPVCAVSYQWKL